jgi:ATP-dependent protease ClpP protease subunit
MRLLAFIITTCVAFTPRRAFLKKYATSAAALASNRAAVTALASATTNASKDDGGALTIHFYGPVSEESCLQLTQALTEYDRRARHRAVDEPSVEPVISLHIQSPGGSLLPTFYVCDVMQNLRTPVHVHVDGFAASAASLIAVCGDRRIMTAHSAMLIHQLSGASSGKFSEMEEEMQNFGFFMNLVKDIYLTHTSMNASTLDTLLSSDVWLPAGNCLEYGLVDEVL